MDPISAFGLAAGILQIINVALKTTKIIASTCTQLKNAPRYLAETHAYVQTLHFLLVTVSQSFEDGGASGISGPLPTVSDWLMESIMTDLQDLGSEVASLRAFFDETAGPQSGHIVGEVTSTTCLVPSGTSTKQEVGAATKLKKAANRGKGRIKAYFKDDRIQELKVHIKQHVDMLTMLCAARGS